MDRHCQIFTSLILNQIQTFFDRNLICRSWFSTSTKIEFNLSFFLSINCYNTNFICNIYLYSFSFSTLQHIPNNPTRTKKKYRIINSLYQEIYYLWYGLLNMKSINYKYVKYTLHICIPNLTFMESNCFINKIREKNP